MDESSASANLSKRLSIISTSKCNVACRHCLCKGSGLKKLSELESSLLINIIRESNIKIIQFTGGEPTLVLPLIRNLFKKLQKEFPYLELEIITNAYFASSYKKCCDILSFLPNLKKVIISYDAFHADFIPMKNIVHVKKYCHAHHISICGFAAIAKPDDFITIYNYEKIFNIEFNYQKVLPIGDANKNNAYYKSGVYDDKLFNEKCPQLSNLVYLPGYGITHCCSSLLFKTPSMLRKKLAYKSINLLRKSRFFTLLSKYTFRELYKMAHIDISKVPLDCFLPCELCYSIKNFILRDA